MSDRFSFDSADDLIELLKTSNMVLTEKNQQFIGLYNRLGDSFRDSEYENLKQGLLHSFSSCCEISQELNLIIAAIANYKEKLYEQFVENLISNIQFPTITYVSTVRFGEEGEALEMKNRQLAFQNEIKMKMRQKDLSIAARAMYASVGSKCKIGSDTYMRTEHYNPFTREIFFNLEADLCNEQGQLATYFHEVGHMIDFQSSSQPLSNDKTFCTAVKSDFKDYVFQTMKRYGCDRSEAYYHIRNELYADSNLLADISDIMGGLTDCECQGAWGHSKKYWNTDPQRVYREAFANMYSTALGNPQRIAVMKKYFPTAYERFEKLLEDTL